MAPRSPPLAVRTLAALGLLAGFYALALGASAALAWIGWRLWRGAGWSSQAAAAVYVAAALLLAAACLVTRRRRFEPPGPDVAAEQPALVKLVRETAASLGAEVPRRIFITPDVNAFVGEVGGFAGLGGTRAMGIGLGLICVDSISELRATIAHELGHTVAGDTRFGPLLHRARTALERVAGMGDGLLARPFEPYRRLFLRVALDVSRRQELAADRAAVSVAGVEAHVSALRREARAGALFGAFLRTEVAPLLARGRRPENVYEGFRAFAGELAAQGRAEEIDRVLAAQPTDPGHTHPSLADRVAFARALPDPAPRPDDRPARSLLVDPERLEREVSARLASALARDVPLEPVAWGDVDAAVWGPSLAEEARAVASRLATGTAGPGTASAGLRALAASVMARGEEPVAADLEPALAEVPPAERPEAARRIVAGALGVLCGAVLVERGGSWRSELGRRLRVALGGELHDPWKLAEEALLDRALLETLPARVAGLGAG